ncbi:MAG: hypothetical protein CMB97_01875 [Flavobacteriaceae bacterium]|nr:hypothetical protein [Flavobacteriaceae bacterium]
MPAFEKAHLSYEKLSYELKLTSSTRAKIKLSIKNCHRKLARVDYALRSVQSEVDCKMMESRELQGDRYLASKRYLASTSDINTSE